MSSASPALPVSALHDLARAAGVDPSYLGHRGAVVTSSDEALLGMLRMLGPHLGFELPSTDAEAIHAAHAALDRARWAACVPPVVVGWSGTIEVPIRTRADIDGDWALAITTESGAQHAAHGRLFTLPPDSHVERDGAIYCIRRARVHVGELGYHTVRWQVAGDGGEAMAIAAPERAFGGPGEGARRWGVFAPVYGLADPSGSGQAGDLRTLRTLFDQVARRGGSYVATLPILAQFLDENYAFSPYSPASRMFWNELYLDLRALAGEAGARASTVPVSLAPPPLVPGTAIDYRAQYAWRRRALDALAPALLASRGSEIDAWAKTTSVYDYAMFRAFGEVARTGWRSWAPARRDAGPVARTRAAAIAAGADAARLDVHVVAQWAMQQQLEALAGATPVGLYLDLPVGVSCDAYEVWRFRDQFLLDASAGAPPDPLFLGGQSWGLPPLVPIAQQRDHYRYVIACIRHHMRVAGMLRIDHVMGLFRLYCVVAGRPATDGVYLRFPWDEMMAILALESSRAKCALVGEDLGTVPEGVRPAMAKHGMFRTHVGQWHLPMRVGQVPEASPRESVASLNTHDMPTFAGWWGGGDIRDQKDLGLIDAAAERAQLVERDGQRGAMLAFAGATSRDTLTDVERAMVAATADLARGPAEIVLVPLDDLTLEPMPHNVPGTVHERANWQRRIARWADALGPDAPPAAEAALAAVVAARPRSE